MARDDDGRVVFVRGALPEEDVTVTLTDAKRDWARGVATEIHQASTARVVPPCPHRREGCGGCDWQHVTADQQLAAKLDIVVDALRRTGKLSDPEVRPGRSVPSTGYRTTIRLVGGADGRPSYRVERSHDTVAASGCLIAHPGLVEVIDGLTVPEHLEVTLRVSAATGEITARWDSGEGDVSGLPEGVGVGPASSLYEHVAGHQFRVSAGSFFQSGPAAAELLVEAVARSARELGHASHVLDAYAGVGLFAVAATPREAHLTVVETSRSAIADARVNLDGRDAQFERLEIGAWRADRGRPIDVAIADPARTGLGRPGVAALTRCEPDVVVLVSCDPVALARDAGLLAAAGYRHDGTEVLDLFPHTHHVEGVTRFVPA